MSVPDLLEAVRSALLDETFIKMTLGSYGGADTTLKNVYIKPVLVKREEMLSFTYRHATRDIVKNYPLKEALQKIEQMLADFASAVLFTSQFDMQLDRGKLRRSKPTAKPVASLAHDRAKTRVIEADGQVYLHRLGVTDASGNVLKSSQDKYKQINKYVEIISGLIKDIPPEKISNIVDMGAGKGYLTFALYDYLANILKIPAVVTGVEFRKDMVDVCNDIARQSEFARLDFVQGTIENYDATDANILIALHACDTATDDAIAKGIEAGAELIVVAPCCHKQIRRELEASKKRTDLDFLTKYGTFLEREAEMVTDGMRALILNYFGYNTKVFEFISDAHTPKNVMIVGVKGKAGKNPQILDEIRAAKDYFGIKRHHLEKIL